MTQRSAAGDRGGGRSASAARLVAGLVTVLGGLAAVYAVTVALATEPASPPPVGPSRARPVASAAGLHLHAAALTGGAGSASARRLPAGRPVRLQLVYVADDRARGDDLVVIWMREGAEIRRSRVALRPGRHAAQVELAAERTHPPGRYRVRVLVEDVALTDLPFEVAPARADPA